MEIIMPKMGESVSEGTIIKWHKKEGDQVKRDEIIFEISTDKVDTEVPSPADGVLSSIKVKEGETVEVGTTVAVIDSNGQQKESAPAESSVKQEKIEKPAEEIKHEAPVETAEKVETTSPSQTKNEFEITMPKMGESVMEGTIIKWHKNIGDKVKKDETIFEISTDKVDTEVPSPAEGILSEILVKEQETVTVGTVVAKISSSEVPVKTQSQERTKKDAEKTDEIISEVKEEPLAMHDNFSGGKSSSLEETEEKKEGGFLSPLVLNIARKENISLDELNSIKGSGLEGRVTKKDVLNYLENKKVLKKEPQQAVQEEKKIPYKTTAEEPKFEKAEPPSSTADIERIPMDNIRQKIMQHMVSSRDTSVHVSAMLEVEMSKVHNFIQKNKDEFLQKEGIKLTYMPFIAQAVVKGLREYPLINSTIEGTTILKKRYVNLGIAVALEPTGLIVPNIKRAEEKSLVGLAKSIIDLAQRSRNKKLTPDDISGGTFTITNYGVFGTIFGTPIINQPEVAILGVGTVIKRPVVVETEDLDTIAIKPVMALTLSHDHRLVDGMLGGKFLKYLKDTLENYDGKI